MARGRQEGPDLFDAVEEEAEDYECPHKYEDETETYWPGYGWRMTYTCRSCKAIRGRCRTKLKK